MNVQCAHGDYMGGLTFLRCEKQAVRKSWGDRGIPDLTARWLCLHHWYREYLDSTHWEYLRERKLRTAGRTCERCKRRAHRTAKGNWAGLHVHHRTYETLGEESLDDLEVLCSQCHEEHHGIITQ